MDRGSFADRSRIYEKLAADLRSGRYSGIELKVLKMENDATGVFVCGATPEHGGQTVWLGFRISGRLVLTSASVGDCSDSSQDIRDKTAVVASAFIGNH